MLRRHGTVTTYVEKPREGVAEHEEAIELSGVSMTYGAGSNREQSVLRDFNLTIASGRFVTVVGPSGCGKSTLLMIVAGLLDPSSGVVQVNGAPIAGPRPDTTSVVFQDSCLLAWRSIASNVALPLEIAGVSKQERMARARGALELVGLGGAADRFPSELSGGMKQRVAIARGIATEPSVLLMDEPFAALDEQSRYEMGEELLRLWDRLRTTVVFVTHSLSEAIFLADEVVALGGSPGAIRDRFEVGFDRPRELSLMGTPEFAVVRDRLYQTLRWDWDESRRESEKS